MNKKYRLTVLNNYGDKILQFEYIEKLDSDIKEGVTEFYCKAEDGRTIDLVTKDTIFIEELKNDT